jgi:hypothetical protein
VRETTDFVAIGTRIPKEDTAMIEQLTGLTGKTVGFKMSGKLHDEDYKKFVPLVDAAIAKEGKVRILAQFHDFHGWDAKALWDDISSPLRIARRSSGSR